MSRLPLSAGLFAGLIASPLHAPAQQAAVPDLRSFPITRPTVVSPDEMRPGLEAMERAMRLPRPRRLDSDAPLPSHDEVVLLEVEACEQEPRDENTVPSCAVYHRFDWQTEAGPIPFYDYTWSATVLNQQLLGHMGDKWHTPIYFNAYYTSDMGGAFYLPIANSVRGIGASVHDMAEYFGSSTGGTLRGLVSMNIWWDCERGWWFQDGCADKVPFSTTFRSLHGVLGQEVGHEWGVFVKYKRDEQLVSQSDWLGRDKAHWSYMLNTGGSPLEGNRWIDNQDGSFSLESVFYSRYSDFDLYAMGVLPAEDVRPTFLIKSPNCGEECDPATPPESGATFVHGNRIDITIDDVIRGNGARSPSYDRADKVSRHLFVFTKLKDDPADYQQALVKLSNVRRFWNEYFYEATHTRMRAITTISGRDDYPRWEFTASAEGWTGANVAARDGRLILTGQATATRDEIQIDTVRPTRAYLYTRVSPSVLEQGKKIRVSFGALDQSGPGGFFEVQPTALAELHTVELAGVQGWKGTLGSMAIGLQGASEGDVVEIDSLRFENAALPDEDRDGIADAYDNCPEVANADQADWNGDGIGDRCQDSDGDGVLDHRDNCREVPNVLQEDRLGDGVGDACRDTDGDGILDGDDNCPDHANPDQLDSKGNGVGDACRKPKPPRKDDGSFCSTAGGTPSNLAACFVALGGLAFLRMRRRHDSAES